MQQQAESISAEAVAAQTISGKTILEFLNTVLALPAIVIEGKNRTAATFQVGDQKAHVGSRLAVFGLIADAPLMRPAASAIEKAGKGALWLAGSTITSGETTLQVLSFLLQARVGRYADYVLDAEKLAKFIEQRQSEPGVSAQFDSGLGKLSLESRDDEKRAIRRSEPAGCLDSTCRTRRLEQSSMDLDNRNCDEHMVINRRFYYSRPSPRS